MTQASRVKALKTLHGKKVTITQKRDRIGVIQMKIKEKEKNVKKEESCL